MSSERDLKAREYIMDYGPESNGPFTDFKEGWDQALQSSEVTKLREENRIMREALETVSKSEVWMKSIIDAKPVGITWKSSTVSIAREALEKVK
jgi:hypothetical protein